MTKARLEAFSDAVIAIIITIMVLALEPPRVHTWQGLGDLWPTFVSYVLSYFYVGVYWANHHHLIHTLRRVNGTIMWLNLHLLFWLSLVPFVTAWLGRSYPASVPTFVYGGVLLLAGCAYYLLSRAVAAQHAGEPGWEAHHHHGRKTRLALLLYAIGLPFAWIGWVHAALALYLGVALAYVIPERRFEGIEI